MRTFMIATLVLAACGPKPTYSRRAQFVEAEYSPYAGPGEAAIEGQAFLKTVGGETKKCAGENVILNPATSYSGEWFEHAIVKEQPITAADERIRPFTRKTVGDADGRFVFENVPAGSYYLTCVIEWGVPRTVYTGFGWVTIIDKNGGPAYARVTVKAGERAKVVVTR